MKSLKIFIGLNAIFLLILCLGLRQLILVDSGIAGINKYLRAKYRKAWKTVSIDSPRSSTSGRGTGRGSGGSGRGRGNSGSGGDAGGSRAATSANPNPCGSGTGTGHTAPSILSSSAVAIDVDHLCIDMNQLLHGCIRGTKSPDHVTAKIFQNLDIILRFSRPTKSLVLAFDGPAPFAKIITQRNRRRSKSLGGLLTPGTDLMNSMENMMLCYILQRHSWPQLNNVSVFISDSKHPGEGELKIINWIKHYMPFTGHTLMGHDNIDRFSSHDNNHSYSSDSTRVVSNTDHLCSDRILIVGSDSDILVQSICISSYTPKIAVLQISQSSNDDPDVICNIDLMMKGLMNTTGVDWIDMHRHFTRDLSSSNRRQLNNNSNNYDGTTSSNIDQVVISKINTNDCVHTDDDDTKEKAYINDSYNSIPDSGAQNIYNSNNTQVNAIYSSFRSVHIDICILFALQGNDYLPKLRGISMKRSLECYGIAMKQLPYEDR